MIQLSKECNPINLSKIKWWNLDINTNDRGCTPRNYGLKIMSHGEYITYLDDDNEYLPHHFETLMNCFQNGPTDNMNGHTDNSMDRRAVQYAFSSFRMIYNNPKDTTSLLSINFDKTKYEDIICSEPKMYRIDTSSIMHRRDLLRKYGYWKNRERADDWEFVSRWINEVYAATKCVTLYYSADPNRVNITGVKKYYPDQPIAISNNTNNAITNNKQSIANSTPDTAAISKKKKKKKNKTANTDNTTTATNSSIDNNDTSATNNVEQSISTNTTSKKFAITTITCNNRDTLFPTIETFCDPERNSYFSNKDDGQDNISKCDIDWYILLQGCNVEHIKKVTSCTEKYDYSNLRFILLVSKQNLGLSVGNNKLAAKVKDYKYVLHIEDDWITLDPLVTNVNNNWLETSIQLLDQNPSIATVFLRKFHDGYNTGLWNQESSYKTFKYDDNGNYKKKMVGSNVIVLHDIQFQHIPKFLFTFNPAIRRNHMYYQCSVYPLLEKQDIRVSTNNETNWKMTQYEDVPEWGWCEADAMEKTRDLTSYNLNSGIFGHHEDWVPLLDTALKTRITAND
jgi:hypothetical protein